MQEVLRILDANLNRAREGLRTAEEFARFVVNDAAALDSLKTVRRGLEKVIAALGPAAPSLLAARDVPGDIGVEPQAPALRRTSGDVAQAGLKRAQEALRVIEEYSHLVAKEAPPLAAQARYALYEAEQRLFAQAPSPLLARLAKEPVMVIITRRMCHSSWRTMLEDLLEAGARVFQLREKRLSARDFTHYAQQFAERARRKDALTIINDRADVAFASGADGVHLGQEDLPLVAARRMLGKGALIGLSCHDLEEAKAAVAAGADYIGLGAMFDTRTKAVTKMAGPALLSEVVPQINVPVLAIGGIKAGNVGELGKAGAKHAAVCSAIIRSRTPGKAYRDIVDALRTGTRIEEPESLPTTEVSP